ncbi:capsular polysaccharide biosynthesis protein [Croceitalea sp. MTPC9]|uniref:tyrosine-protein phosphatase n=1 Tax=unclassified Croceitalea TaxID=2632280 RepID=UPI002B37618C|nr:capsular polysaccharide biosynthesis protein [Croceitalea sp. MTPC6]GMN15986.1 capsular polysaccharide biosynthesis protein [Croceitalea sp. MTPC9]
MFDFFTKKEYLVDHLNGIVDIHNHILPGIDDGAKNVEESIELIKGFKEFGVNKFICTPHIMHNYYDNTPKSIKKSFKVLKKELKNNNIDNIDISYAAEHMIDENFEHLLENNAVLPLNSNHILVEMSYLQPSINFNQSVEKIIRKGIFPVFAHPERYQYLNTDLKNYEKLKSQGLKFQLNLLSLGGYYGADVKKAALQLLENNLYDFLGSDAHNTTHIQSLKSIKLKGRYARNLLYLIHNNRIFGIR